MIYAAVDHLLQRKCIRIAAIHHLQDAPSLSLSQRRKETNDSRLQIRLIWLEGDKWGFLLNGLVSSLAGLKASIKGKLHARHDKSMLKG